MCDVFFFGTALSIPSHISRRKSDTPAKAVIGIASARAGIEGIGIRRKKGDVRYGWRVTAGCSNWTIEGMGGSRRAMVVRCMRTEVVRGEW